MCGGVWRRGGAVLVFPGALLLGASQVAAQEVAFGVRAGLNLSAVMYDEGSASNPVVLKPGLHLGVASAMRVSRYVSLEAAGLLSQDGFRGEGGHPGDFQMDYVDVPVLVKLRLPTRISPHILAGLNVGYMVRCRITGVAFVDQTTCDDPMVGTRWRSLDLGGLLGLGAALDTSRGNFGLDLFVGLGMRDLKEDLLPPGSAKRGAIRISLTWLPGAGGRS